MTAKMRPIIYRRKQRKSPEIVRFQDFSGGDKRDRTADLMTASHALSQLSYTPEWNYFAYEVLRSANCAKKRGTFVGA